MEDDDPLDREEYAAGFKLDRWERFHHIEGDETDRAYQRIATLRKHYGRYRGKVKGEPPGTPSTIRIPHTKGTTPDREVAPMERFARSEPEGSDQEEGEITQTEGEGSGAFTQMRPRDSDYRYDRDDEREPMQSLRSVVVVPQGQEQQEEVLHQQELSPAVPGDRMTLVGPEMVAEACDTLVQERHPASPPVWPKSGRSPTEDQPAEKKEAGVLAEPPTPQRKLASTPAPQRDGSLRGTERKPESALFSPSPVVGQKQPPPVCSRVPETESSESDASDEPGPKEDLPHRGARPAVEMEEDPEAAEIDQEEAGGAEPPSAQLELAVLNGLDISSLPALRDLSTGARTTVHIPWPPVGLERATPEWRRRASQAMAFLLGGRGGEH